MSNSSFASRWAWADIDLGAVRNNVTALIAANPSQQLWAVVKANAYGHGAVEVANAALQAGASGLCVALADEALALRAAGITAPVLVMSEQPASQYTAMIEHDVIATLYNETSIKQYSKAANDAKRTALVHLKIDTGMHRVGVGVDSALTAATMITSQPSLQLDGVYTHLATADDAAHLGAALQMRRFSEVVDQLGKAGIAPRHVHVANSAAAVRRLGSELHTTMVRAGIALFGIASDASSNSFGEPTSVELQPVLSLKARVSHVQWLDAGEAVSYGLRRPLSKRTCIATLPLGYADGVTRGLWSNGHVLIGGKKRPFAGVITMDQAMIDCGDDTISVGDEAVLIGQQGKEAISANDWAALLGTIGYEVVCGVSARVPRNYLQ
jgi:alanine racemase